MANDIPDDLSRDDLLWAISEIDSGIKHKFSASISYDVLFNGKRYPPKAVVGIAASRVLGRELGPYDFKAGLNTKCFLLLEACGFRIVQKREGNQDFEGLYEDVIFIEGAAVSVISNRYERDQAARTKCLQHYGFSCVVCGFNFEKAYGPIGRGFIHVHHVVPLSAVKSEYRINPIEDLRPICPNCHAMIHKKYPPYSIHELKTALESMRSP